MNRLGKNSAMTYRLEYISTFYTDVLQVIKNLEEYPQKAERILSKLDKILINLVYMPEMYPVYEAFPIFRKIAIEDYLTFYIVNKRDRLIEIHRLLYSRMDIAKQFKYINLGE